MASVSEQKKVQLLEEAVLANDCTKVQALFDEYKTFEFTARALGLACRYAGTEMVELLLKQGAGFDYKDTPTLERKYGCKRWYSNNNYVLKDYVLMALEDCKNIPCGNDVKITNKRILKEDKRADAVKALTRNQKKHLKKLLFYSILVDEQKITSVLLEAGINKLPGYEDDLISGIDGFNPTYIGRIDRSWVFDQLFALEPRKLRTMIELLCSVSSAESWKIFPSDLEPGYRRGPNRFERIMLCCSPELFGFFYEKTDLLDRVNRGELYEALVEADNAEALSKTVQHFGDISYSQYETMLKNAQEKGKREVTAWLLNYKVVNPEMAQKAARAQEKQWKALDANPNSVSELKKIWEYKKLKDGEIIITSYKGEALDVIVPEKIGRSTVTAIDSNAFSLSSYYVSAQQKEVRKNIQSLALPGTIKEIPEWFFNSRDYSTKYELKKLVIGEGTKKIGWGAFGSCPEIEELILPRTIKEIEKFAFDYCGDAAWDKIDDVFSRRIPDFYKGVRYRKQDDAIEIIGIVYARKGVVKIPNEIDGMPVRKICDLEGKNNRGDVEYNGYVIQTLMIPENVVEIEGRPSVKYKITVDENNPVYAGSGNVFYKK